MSDFTGPRRLEVAELERRVLDAARNEEPSRAMSERMAGALGISSAALAAGSAEAASLGASTGPSLTVKAAEGAGAAGWAPWVAGFAIVAGVGAAVVAMQSSGEGQPRARVIQVAPSAEPELPEEIVPVLPSVAPPTETEVTKPPRPLERARQTRATQQAPELRDEIALIDAARSALRSGRGGRTLELVGDYSRRFPRGSFRPEARALQIEALVELGRTAEARALAERFVAERRGTPLGDRIARLVGLDDEL